VVKRRVNTVPGIQSTDVNVVWDPIWTPQKISPEGASSSVSTRKSPVDRGQEPKGSLPVASFSLVLRPRS
jgi:metal-sulfur cluster biosynthetic enzyme